MNIVMINGSFKKKGVTASVMDILYEKLIECGAEVTRICLCDYKVNYCVGCTTCYAKGYCPLDKQDGFMEVRKAIEEADGVVLGSPNYVSSVTGLFKSFIDRMDFVTGQVLYNKHFVSIATFQNIRGGKVNNYIVEQARLAGGIMSGKIAVKVNPYIKPYTLDDDRVTIEATASTLVDGIKQQKGPSLIEKVYRRVVKHNISRFMDDKEHYGGLIRGWQAKGII